MLNAGLSICTVCISYFTLVKYMGILSITSLVDLIWFSLPEGDQKRRTFENNNRGNNLYAERVPRVLGTELWRHVVLEATVVCDCGGAVVSEQCGGRGDSGFHFQHLMSSYRYIHRQHHVGLHKAFSNVALELRRPTVFPGVS